MTSLLLLSPFAVWTTTGSGHNPCSSGGLERERVIDPRGLSTDRDGWDGDHREGGREVGQSEMDGMASAASRPEADGGRRTEDGD